jgi:hypothetical protein
MRWILDVALVTTGEETIIELDAETVDEASRRSGKRPPSKRKLSSMKGRVFQLQTSVPTSLVNEVRQNVDTWRALPSPSQWQVALETARLLQHWRHHKFAGIRPFFLPGGSG